MKCVGGGELFCCCFFFFFLIISWIRQASRKRPFFSGRNAELDRTGCTLALQRVPVICMLFVFEGFIHTNSHTEGLQALGSG